MEARAAGFTAFMLRLLTDIPQLRATVRLEQFRWRVVDNATAWFPAVPAGQLDPSTRATRRRGGKMSVSLSLNRAGRLAGWQPGCYGFEVGMHDEVGVQR